MKDTMLSLPVPSFSFSFPPKLSLPKEEKEGSLWLIDETEGSLAIDAPLTVLAASRDTVGVTGVGSAPWGEMGADGLNKSDESRSISGNFT